MKNNKKGFTLIELLAVIVILAIIALIATPIVLNIINDAKEESDLRSGEFYLKSLELSIAQAILDGQNIQDKEYNIMPNGNICLEKYSNVGDTIECKNDDVNDADNSKSNELIVEVKGKVPTSGTITIVNGQIGDISLKLNDKEIVKDEKGELKYKTEEIVSKEKTLDEVCTYVSGTAKTAGAKYSCKVDPNREPYTFYVLTTPKEGDTSINLIMDSNINNDGSPATKYIYKLQPENGIYNTVEWINEDDYLLLGGSKEGWDNWNSNSMFGPITAMNYIQEATKNWTNTNKMKISNFTDETGKEYEMPKTYNVYARLPYYHELSNSGETKVYLYDNLDFPDCVYIDDEGLDNYVSCDEEYTYVEGVMDDSLTYIEDMQSYLTLSVDSQNHLYEGQSMYIFEFNYAYGLHNYYAENDTGVRPVISLKI